MYTQLGAAACHMGIYRRRLPVEISRPEDIPRFAPVVSIANSSASFPESLIVNKTARLAQHAHRRCGNLPPGRAPRGPEPTHLPGASPTDQVLRYSPRAHVTFGLPAFTRRGAAHHDERRDQARARHAGIDSRSCQSFDLTHCASRMLLGLVALPAPLLLTSATLSSVERSVPPERRFAQRRSARRSSSAS